MELGPVLCSLSSELMRWEELIITHTWKVDCPISKSSGNVSKTPALLLHDVTHHRIPQISMALSLLITEVPLCLDIIISNCSITSEELSWLFVIKKSCLLHSFPILPKQKIFKTEARFSFHSLKTYVLLSKENRNQIRKQQILFSLHIILKKKNYAFHSKHLSLSITWSGQISV